MNGFKIPTRHFVLDLLTLTSIPRGICAPRPDADNPVKGDGIIDRVMATGSEPVFRADGYDLHIDSSEQ